MKFQYIIEILEHATALLYPAATTTAVISAGCFYNRKNPGNIGWVWLRKPGIILLTDTGSGAGSKNKMSQPDTKQCHLLSHPGSHLPVASDSTSCPAKVSPIFTAEWLHHVPTVPVIKSHTQAGDKTTNISFWYHSSKADSSSSARGCLMHPCDKVSMEKL